MRIINDVFDQLLANFNQKNSTALTRSQVEFKDIRPVDSITPRPNTTKNTAITMAVKRNAPLTGEVTLFYDRIQLRQPYREAPLQNGTLKFQVMTEKTVVELLPKINQRLGTRLTADDVVDRPLSLRKGFDIFDLVASPMSPNFIGVLSMLAIRVDNPETDVVLDTYKPLWYYDNLASETVSGTPLIQKALPSLFTYHNDYSAIADYLHTVPAYDTWTALSVADGLVLANALKSCDGRGWTSITGKGAANLRGAWVMYNGPIDQVPDRVGIVAEDIALMGTDAFVGFRSDEFDNVMLIRTDAPYSDGYSNRSAYIIHYNNEVS